MTALEIRLLGGFQIRRLDAPLEGFEAPRVQSLLAYLLLHRGAPQSRKHVAFLLWQDSSEKQAHANLRNLIYVVRKALPDGDTFFFADAQQVSWNANAPYVLDVAEFEKLCADNGQSATDDGQRKSHLAAAVELYRGDLLPACYDEWIFPARERLRENFVDALAELMVLYEKAREFQNAIQTARRLLQADPLREETYRKLMQLHARLGERANVLRVYQTCVAVFRRELDAEPDAATRELFEQLRYAETAPEIPDAPGVRHSDAKHNLPVALTGFVGRTRELAETRALLDRARLVTLLGVGGGGKTRLALETARSFAAQFSDGVWFVDLAPLSDASDVVRACASVLGVREQAGTRLTDVLIEHTRAQRLLLVLDNCEHIRAACAELAHTLLERAPDLKILATSREPLGLLGEALLPVPPLSLPDLKNADLETAARSDAVQLFVARASFLLPSFALHQGNLNAIAQICRRLDGIPLAIELAAARIRTLSPAQIATRLDDALSVLTRGSSDGTTRHQTMRTVLDWSDALLSDQERMLFRRLGVFAGGFSLEMAEQICAGLPAHSREPALAPDLILELLSNLIDKSLVRVTHTPEYQEARYGLLEPIRQYAREKLELAQEQADLTFRHLTCFQEFAKHMRAELAGPTLPQALAHLEREHDNLRAALDAANRSEWRPNGLALAVALERFWLIGGHVDEGYAIVTRLLHLRRTQSQFDYDTLQENPRLTASALALAGTLAFRQNELSRAEAYLSEASTLFQTQHDRAGIASVQNRQGEVARVRGDYARAVALQNESLELSRETGNRQGIASALLHLGSVYSETGNYDQARMQYEQGLEIAEPLGDPWLLAVLKNNLGVALRLSDPARSEELAYETLEIRRALGDRYGTAISLRNLGEMALARKDWARAREMFTASLELNQNIHNDKGTADCLVGLAWVEWAQGNAERAARLLGQSEALRERLGVVLPEDDRAEYNDLVSKLRAQLEPQRFQAAWADGRAHTSTLPS